MAEKKPSKAAETSKRAIPDHVAAALIGADNSIELLVGVTDRDGVNAYGFAWGGAPVPMKGGKGKFFASPGVTKLLEWVMVGDPGGTMHVTVTRDGATVEEREKSTISPPGTKDYDAFEIKVD